MSFCEHELHPCIPPCLLMKVFVSKEFGHCEHETRSCTRIFATPPEEYRRLDLETDVKIFGACGCVFSEQLLALHILSQCASVGFPEASIPLLWLCACHLAYHMLDDEELTVRGVADLLELKTAKPIIDYEYRLLVLTEFGLSPPAEALQKIFALVCQIGSRMPQQCRFPWGNVSDMELEDLARFQETMASGDVRDFAKRGMYM